MNNLAGKSAIITGAGSGIGRATALTLAGEGAQIAVFDIDEVGANETCALIEGSGGRAISVLGSVADSAEVAQGFAQVEEGLGSIDILVNNAGIAGNYPTLDLSDEDWNRAVNINQTGVFYCCREAGKRMVAQRSGTIVNVASVYGVLAAPNRIHYCATKAAVEMMARSLAIEWAQDGVRVNSIAPGYVESDFLKKLAQEGRVDMEAIYRRTPQGRIATFEEIADAILYLCEPRSRHMTGHTLVVDGGWSAQGGVV